MKFGEAYKMKIFVTGLHRAGTNSLAMKLAREHKFPYLNEHRIKYDSIEAAELLAEGKSPKWTLIDGKWNVKGLKDSHLEKGFVLQCPFLAHKVLDLAQWGKVYWCYREEIELITAMKNAGINEIAWHIMKGFREEFPDDPIWATLEYDGSEDVHDGFVRYYKLVVKVKDHFLQTKFKDHCEISKLEDRQDYDLEKELSKRKPLKARELKAIK